MASVSESVSEETPAPVASHLTLAWFAKRSALWLFFMTVGVGAACCLYAYASEAEPAASSASVVTSSVTPANKPAR